MKFTRENQRRTGNSEDDFESRAPAEKRRVPLIIYPLVIMFAIYLLWELFARLSISP